jgi:hypothetical protein
MLEAFTQSDAASMDAEPDANEKFVFSMNKKTNPTKQTHLSHNLADVFAGGT